MQIFGQNPNRIVEGYTEEFENIFLEHVWRSHRFSRIAVTVVYNEYICDRHHLHMNSTRWLTLTVFVKYLGRTGKCKAELLSELNVEDRVKIGFSLGSSAKPVTKEKREGPKVLFDEVEDAKKEERTPGGSLKKKESGGGKLTLDELMREDERKREKINRKDYWLHEGIVVKVMRKPLADKGYYKQKDVVIKVIDKYIGEIEMLESKHVLRVDQAELETMIPQVGALVKIVNGAYRGSTARLLGVDTDHFCAKVQIKKGTYDGSVLKAVEYEDICKLGQ